MLLSSLVVPSAHADVPYGQSGYSYGQSGYGNGYSQSTYGRGDYRQGSYDSGSDVPGHHQVGVCDNGLDMYEEDTVNYAQSSYGGGGGGK